MKNKTLALPVVSSYKAPPENPASNAGDEFYRTFEDLHRGTRELIKGRLQVYLPFILHCQELYEECPALDLGCGRGEWLELLTENGFDALGVDIDDGMLAACIERSLPIEKKDALAALKELPDGSHALISGFHIAEHLPFDTLRETVKETLRVLKPGGLLILETPNPENIYVGTTNFYLDPTHMRPLPPLLLSFLAEYCGFARTKVLRLQEPPHLMSAAHVNMRDFLGGASPDYAVIAQKKTNPWRMALFDAEFEKEYGLSTDDLAARYDATIAEKFADTSSRIDAAEQKIERTFADTADRIDAAEQRNNVRFADTSSRINASEQRAEARFAETSALIEAAEQRNDVRLAETTGRIDAIEHAAGKRIGELRGDIAELECELKTNFGEYSGRLDALGHAQTLSAEVQEQFSHTLAARFQELEARAIAMEAAFRAVRSSRSWRMTAPYRAVGDFLKGSWQGFKNLLKPPAAGAMRFVIANNSLRLSALSMLRPFPGLKARMKRLALARGVVEMQDGAENPPAE